MTEKLKHHEKSEKIIEMRKTGASWGAISTALDIPPRSLYALRNSEGFVATANAIWMDIMDGLKKQQEAGEASPYHMDQFIKNSIKVFMLLSGTSLDGLIGSELKLADCNQECPHYNQVHKERVDDFQKTFDLFCASALVEKWQIRRYRAFLRSDPDFYKITRNSK